MDNQYTVEFNKGAQGRFYCIRLLTDADKCYHGDSRQIKIIFPHNSRC